MTYKYLLFDMDGTLFDYDKAEAAALQNAFESFDIKFEKDFLKKYREINDVYWQRFEQGTISLADLKMQRFADLGRDTGSDFEPALFSKRYLEYLSAGTFLLDGAEKLLEKIKGAYRIYIITNGIKKVQRPRLAGSSITEYFDGIIISEETGSAKPDPGIFDAAFKMMGSPPKEHVLIIGDSLSSDIAGGNNYGIDTCWYNPSRLENSADHSPKYEIEELTQLLPIITS